MSNVGVIMMGLGVNVGGVVVFVRGGGIGVMFLWIIIFWK